MDQALISCVATALRRLKHPFYFEQDTIYGPDTFVDKWLGHGGKEAKLRREMQNALNYCDRLGFRFVQRGSVSLALIVFSEHLSPEEAIGRSVVVQESTHPFAQFDMRSGWAFPFHVNIFYVFSSSEKAFSFRNTAQDKCKHTKIGLLRTVLIKPWCIDYHGMHVTPPKGILSGLDKEPSEIESKLFEGL